MTVTTHIIETDRGGPVARLRRLAVRLQSCRRAATISEYGLLAMLIVSAAGVAHSPRLHAVKDTRCEAPQASCFRDHPAPVAQTRAIKPKTAHPAHRTASEDKRPKGAPAPLQPNG
jgi:hypothetical protein